MELDVFKTKTFALIINSTMKIKPDFKIMLKQMEDIESEGYKLIKCYENGDYLFRKE